MTVIDLSLQTDGITVKVKGHAGYDKSGKDIVCSAVSILSYTLVSAITENTDLFSDVIAEMQPGNVNISAVPCSYDAVKIVRCICRGFELLAKKYPDNVKINIL